EDDDEADEGGDNRAQWGAAPGLPMNLHVELREKDEREEPPEDRAHHEKADALEVPQGVEKASPETLFGSLRLWDEAAPGFELVRQRGLPLALLAPATGPGGRQGRLVTLEIGRLGRRWNLGWSRALRARIGRRGGRPGGSPLRRPRFSRGVGC